MFESLKKKIAAFWSNLKILFKEIFRKKEPPGFSTTRPFRPFQKPEIRIIPTDGYETHTYYLNSISIDNNRQIFQTLVNQVLEKQPDLSEVKIMMVGVIKDSNKFIEMFSKAFNTTQLYEQKSSKWQSGTAADTSSSSAQIKNVNKNVNVTVTVQSNFYNRSNLSNTNVIVYTTPCEHEQFLREVERLMIPDSTIQVVFSDVTPKLELHEKVDQLNQPPTGFHP